MSIPVERHSIPNEQKSLIASRYKTVTRAVNRSLWELNSDTAHSIYVGSYGRGTAIDTSDVDILIEVPQKYYIVDSYSTYNPQSRLLQVVKNSILDTYPRSNVRGDGQVVVIDFSDGMKFEVLPAIPTMNLLNQKQYKYPDTHMGGNWLSTDPKAEQDAIAIKDKQTNGLLKATCKHIRWVRDHFFSSYHLSGIVIDSFVYMVIGGWHFLYDGEEKISNGETFEEMLLRSFNQLSWTGQHSFDLFAPGSNMKVDTTGSIICFGKVLNKMVG